jgi:hypothetical protein
MEFKIEKVEKSTMQIKMDFFEMMSGKL